MSRFLLALLTLATVSAYQQPSSTATELSRLIRETGLDPGECYRVRDLNFTKDDVRLYLNDGYLIFSKPVLGQRLAAVFATDVEGGDGEVIVIPSTRSERQSLAAFTQSPNLDEHFRAALMIFSDGSGARLLESLQSGSEDGTGKKAPEMGAVLAGQWTPVVSNISAPMQTRLVGDLLASRPAETGVMLLAISGKALGTFDIIMDARAGRRVVVRQRSEGSGKDSGRDGYDVWTDFLPRAVVQKAGKPVPAARDFTLSRYRIETEISTREGGGLGVKAVTRVTVRVGADPVRAFRFEITRVMQIGAVRIDGSAAEVLRDESLRGRIALNQQEFEFLAVAPAPLAAGTEHEFEFEHQGNVITTRGDGVYFVNARGTWYPHVGAGFATYDLTFRYPKRLTLVAAGDAVEDRVDGDWRITRRRTPVAIGAAGFNLGVYEKVTGTAAGINFEVYGNRNLEDALRPKVVFAAPAPGIAGPTPPMMRPRGASRLPPEPPPPLIMSPDPRGRLRAVAEDLSASLEFFSGLFGPPVMKTLTVAPIPGTFGQGFPGLVYLSTFAYIEPSERPAALRNAREQTFFSDLMVPHEAAHQWWGGIVASQGPEDEWLMESLASYSSLLWLEKKRGLKEVEKVLDGYRDELLSKDEGGAAYDSAGPIVWGERLSTSSMTRAWRVITYGKGAWILHMLRRRIGDDAFLKVLAELRKRYEFQPLTTADFRALVRELRPKGVSAEAIDTFFDNWVYATGIPSLKLKYTVKGVAPSVTLSGAITQSGVEDDFSTDTPVEVQFGKGVPQTIWVRTAGEGGAFTANLRQIPTRVAIPDDVLMKK